MFEYYIGYIALVLGHELSHFVLLKAFHVGMVQITIGNIFHVRVGNFHLSPFVINGKTTFSCDDYDRLPFGPKFLIISAGPLSNFAMGGVLSDAHWLLSTISYFMGIMTILPLPFLKTDGWNLVMELRRRFR